ncbi:PREDICTED: translational activator of cytochrome c oxidase 1 [Dinoponera quadriceps]|uniref:Translational activator of cytochrome c oxidase 1 n=1 Tax=Dinoponera quadriceps TaxID=609295 RepID=A0A6P3XAN6_DINQU|nr:PREDICTED: translational activator of cytochrome c oxidase 1 [Dinoponera quadriceps]
MNRVLINRCIYLTLKDGKRFKGHSKWQNIKHIKAANDHEKMVLFSRFRNQMKFAIKEHGSAKPEDNLKLAQIIEQAKKANMPLATIKNCIEKIESRKDKTKEGTIEIRGPGSYVMIAHYMTDNTKQMQLELNCKLKKCSGKIADSSIKNLFAHIGNIIVEKKGTLEEATDDAINVGAENVEEFEEDDEQYFQFTCDPKDTLKIKHLLESRQYYVVSVTNDYVPHNVVQLNESDLKSAFQIRERILSLEDINDIYDNIVQD